MKAKQYYMHKTTSTSKSMGKVEILINPLTQTSLGKCFI